MNKGLQKQRFPGILPDELLIKERSSIINRLDKLGVKDDIIKEKVLQGIYK